MTVHKRPEQASELIIAEADGGCTVRRSGSGRVHYLTSTAAAILLLCDGSRSQADIAGILQQSYKLSSPPVEDVADLVEEFTLEGLLVDE